MEQCNTLTIGLWGVPELLGLQWDVYFGDMCGCQKMCKSDICEQLPTGQQVLFSYSFKGDHLLPSC